jgi:hypothetical protein
MRGRCLSLGGPSSVSPTACSCLSTSISTSAIILGKSSTAAQSPARAVLHTSIRPPPNAIARRCARTSFITRASILTCHEYFFRLSWKTDAFKTYSRRLSPTANEVHANPILPPPAGCLASTKLSTPCCHLLYHVAFPLLVRLFFALLYASLSNGINGFLYL